MPSRWPTSWPTGAPFFLSTDTLHQKEDGKWGWSYPSRWQFTPRGKASHDAIDSWEPGYALCMVTGRAVDGTDIDRQHGGSLEDIPAGLRNKVVLAVQLTPSGGWHLITHPMNHASVALSHPGIELKSGLPGSKADWPEGKSSRRFLHVAPTIGVPKVALGMPGRDEERIPYRWASADLGMEVDSGDMDEYLAWLLVPPVAASSNGSASQDASAPVPAKWEYADGIDVLREHGIPQIGNNAQRRVFLKVTRELVQLGRTDEEIIEDCLRIAAKHQDEKRPWLAPHFADMIKGPRKKFGHPGSPAAEVAEIRGSSKPDAAGKRVIFPGPGDPMAVARRLLLTYTRDGLLTLRRWRGSWYRHEGPAWGETGAESLAAEVYGVLEKVSCRTKPTKAKPEGEVVKWAPNRAKVADVLAAMAAITLVPDAVEPPAWLGDEPEGISGNVIATTSGLLDAAGRELHNLTPAYFNLTSVAIAYDPLAPVPAAWLKFLGELWPDDPESISTLQECFGYVISGSNAQQKIVLLVGPKRSGKGTIAKALRELVGKGNHAAPTLSSLKERFGLQSLIGKSLAIISDARKAKEAGVVVERLLSISGDDEIDVDRKNKDIWTGRLGARFIVLSNEVPQLEDASAAIADRFIIIPLSNSFLGREDTGLFEKLRPELPGILNWALDGLDRLGKRGRLIAPGSAADAMETMHSLASPVREFVADKCFVSDKIGVPRPDLFNLWVEWARERNCPAGTEQQFGRDLRAAVPSVKGIRPRGGGAGRPRWHMGIGLRRAVAAFVRDCCVPGPAAECFNDELREAWESWCKKKKRAPGEFGVFTNDLVSVVPWLKLPEGKPEEWPAHAVIKGVDPCK